MERSFIWRLLLVASCLSLVTVSSVSEVLAWHSYDSYSCKLEDKGPPARWGAFKVQATVSPYTDRYSAILWEIPRGKSWECWCAHTEAPSTAPEFIRGYLPTRCVNTIFNIWGEWDYRQGLGVKQPPPP
jgi:hypothetical protein